MGVRSDQGKRDVMGAIKASVKATQEDEENLTIECKKQFASLPTVPNGEVLSKQAAIRAVKSAASHYAKEKDRYEASPKSSKINTQLKEIAATAGKAAECMAKANEHLQELNKLLSKLGKDAIRRIEAVPTPILRILNESKSARRGLMLRPHKKALEVYGDAELSEIDLHSLRSELFRFLADKTKTDTTYAQLQDEEQIARIESLKIVCNSAAVLEGVANPKGGPKRAFQEFSLFPSYQLVEACMAILKAGNLPEGNSRDGALLTLATAIRQSVDGYGADAVARAIEDLPLKTLEGLPALKGRIYYWSLILLINDIKSLPQPDSNLRLKLSKMEEEKKEWHARLSKNTLPTSDKRRQGDPVHFKYGPWRDIDDASPFG